MLPDSKLATRRRHRCRPRPEFVPGFPPGGQYEAASVSFWVGGNTHWRLSRKDQSGQNTFACQHSMARFKLPSLNCQSPIDPETVNPKQFSPTDAGRGDRCVIAMIRNLVPATRRIREIFSTIFRDAIIIRKEPCEPGRPQPPNRCGEPPVTLIGVSMPAWRFNASLFLRFPTAVLPPLRRPPLSLLPSDIPSPAPSIGTK